MFAVIAPFSVLELMKGDEAPDELIFYVYPFDEQMFAFFGTHKEVVIDKENGFLCSGEKAQRKLVKDFIIPKVDKMLDAFERYKNGGNVKELVGMYVSMLRFKDIVHVALSADVKKATIKLLDAKEYAELLERIKKEYEENASEYEEDEGEEEALNETLSFAVTSILNLLSVKGRLAPEERRPLLVRLINDVKLSIKDLGRTVDEVIAKLNIENKKIFENYLRLFGTVRTLVRKDVFVPIDEVLEQVFSLLLLRNIAEFEESGELEAAGSISAEAALVEHNYIM